MTAALDNFAHIAAPHKMLILGEMRELGLSSASAHKQVAEQALSSDCEEVWFVGENFQPYAEGALWFPDVEAVKTAITGGQYAHRQTYPHQRVEWHTAFRTSGPALTCSALTCC